MPKRRRIDALDWLSDRTVQGVIWTIQRLPYKPRIRTMGWLTAYVLGPMAGYRRRAMEHLAYIYPDMPLAQQRAIATGALDNMGRTIIENYSHLDQISSLADHEPQGPGWHAMQAAKAEGRPILLVSAHYGNWQALRVVLNRKGFAVGGLFRPFNNSYANAHYVRSFESVGGRAFPRTRRGLAEYVRSLRAGGTMAIMVDQHVADGAELTFLGKSAATSLGAADIALKQNALMVPCYGQRKLDDGFSFDLIFEEPIPHGDPATMTQALNDSLSACIAQRPEQWFWVHRRWKPKRMARRSAKRARRETPPVS